MARIEVAAPFILALAHIGSDLACGAKPARGGLVYRVVRGERIRIRGGGGTGDEQRVAVEEAADGGIVEPGAELGDAERLQQVTLVPLLAAVDSR
jgi:hypothetical protein